jgi:uncharacterized protein YdeI (YjbR/CyaY-like superfamily)
MVKPTFFATPEKFRAWLERNHAVVAELWVGYRKRATGLASITWPESVDEALCFGWIDGVRKSLGEASYVIRFTPRKPTSNWSAINIRRVAELRAAGKMRPAGENAFAARDEKRSAIYSYEREHGKELTPAHQKKLRANARAWKFFSAQPPWYRRTAAYWVNSAKREETRERRLATLVADSAAGRSIKLLTRPVGRSGPGK